MLAEARLNGKELLDSTCTQLTTRGLYPVQIDTIGRKGYLHVGKASYTSSVRHHTLVGQGPTHV